MSQPTRFQMTRLEERIVPSFLLGGCGSGKSSHHSDRGSSRKHSSKKSDKHGVNVTIKTPIVGVKVGLFGK